MLNRDPSLPCAPPIYTLGWLLVELVAYIPCEASPSTFEDRCVFAIDVVATCRGRLAATDLLHLLLVDFVPHR